MDRPNRVVSSISATNLTISRVKSHPPSKRRRLSTTPCLAMRLGTEGVLDKRRWRFLSPSRRSGACQMSAADNEPVSQSVGHSLSRRPTNPIRRPPTRTRWFGRGGGSRVRSSSLIFSRESELCNQVHTSSCFVASPPRTPPPPPLQRNMTVKSTSSLGK